MTLDEVDDLWRAKNTEIRRHAADIVNDPAVLEGYAGAGQDRCLPFIHIVTMSRKRLRKILGLIDPKLPVMGRIEALCEVEVAGALVRFYKARREGKGGYYDYKMMTRDIDERVTRVARDYEAVSAEYHKDVGQI